jgi:hypothetical protein
MAVKVFFHDISRAFYRGNPVASFEIELNYAVCLSSGLPPLSDPHTEEGSMVLEFPVTASPNEVYQKAYDKLLALCTENGWESPTKADIYTWLPTTFDQLLPE